MAFPQGQGSRRADECVDEHGAGVRTTSGETSSLLDNCCDGSGISNLERGFDAHLTRIFLGTTHAHARYGTSKGRENLKIMGLDSVIETFLDVDKARVRVYDFALAQEQIDKLSECERWVADCGDFALPGMVEGIEYTVRYMTEHANSQNIGRSEVSRQRWFLRPRL
jgi:hypothetical protein